VLLPGLVLAVVSEVARRSPGFAALAASLPMFLLVPALPRGGVTLGVSMGPGCGLTIVLQTLVLWIGPRFGLLL
jgi:hypothetical protein